MTMKLSLKSISTVLVALGVAALVACGAKPEKVDSPVDEQTAPTDPVKDTKDVTEDPVEGSGGAAADETKTDDDATDEGGGEEKKDDSGETKDDKSAG